MTGEYVAFLDSDDAFVLEAIEKSLDAMQANCVDSVVFKCIKCKTAKKSTLKKMVPKTIFPTMLQGTYSRNEALKAIANRKINFAAWNKLYKSNIWKNIRFPEEHVYEDLYIIFQIFEKINKIFVMDDVLVKYRSRAGSISGTMSLKNFKDLLEAWSIVEDFVEINTPEIFDIKQLQKIRIKKFNDLVLHYVVGLSSNSHDKDEVLNLIKEDIKNNEKTIKSRNCQIEIKLVYYMMFNYPNLLSTFYIPCLELYKYIKNFLRFIRGANIKKITNKHFNNILFLKNILSNLSLLPIQNQKRKIY